MLHHEFTGRYGGPFSLPEDSQGIEPREGKTALNVLFYEEGPKGPTKRDFAKRKRIDPPMLHHDSPGRGSGFFFSATT